MEYLKKVTDAVHNTIPDIELYAIGGCVRDSIIGNEIKDFDFCSPNDIDNIEIAIKAAGRHVYGVGKKFGTLGFKVLVGDKYQLVEITQFRKESYKPNNRKPEVKFVTDLQQDLSRRDFTINAIALKDGEFFDPWGGRLDILAKKIKAVGEATDRFKEDALRMLRAARFAAQLDFQVDPNMIGKIRKMPERILGISRERWTQEMDKLLTADQAERGLDVLVETYLLRYMLPEVYNIFKQPEFIDLKNKTLWNLDGAKNTHEAWAALLSQIGKPFAENKMTKNGELIYINHNLIAQEISKGIISRLKFSNERAEIILNYLKTSK